MKLQSLYLVLELADCELLGVRLFPSAESAGEVFEACAKENLVREFTGDDLKNEVHGTVRFAGDSAYSVQVVHRQVIL